MKGGVDTFQERFALLFGKGEQQAQDQAIRLPQGAAWSAPNEKRIEPTSLLIVGHRGVSELQKFVAGDPWV